MAETSYATVAQLKAQLTIATDDTSRDDDLARVLAATSRGIDDATGRRFWLDDAPVPRVVGLLGRTLADADGDRLLVRDIGSLDGLVVETGRAGSWSDVTAGVEPDPPDALDEGKPITSLLLVSSRWPAGGGQRARITARWGYPAVPGPIAEATLIQATRLYKRKDSPEGVMGSAEWGVVRISRRDPDVWALIEKYILDGFA
ncbi:phage gp6-like head-tail connector protein [Kitasatospora cineracea]|uniref:phage gp6-like head-tail connector protein n=1 Tax=Kitasatospora cineracea TaxID=88074 RepID=UPI0036AD88BB